MKARCLLVLLLIAICVPAALGASSLTVPQRDAVLLEAHDAYALGLQLRSSDVGAAKQSFLRAVDRFRVLEDDGVINGALLYNLGNAQVQAGRIGAGIATYLRAEPFMGADARLTENLAYARSLVRTQVRADGGDAMLDRLLFWHTAWSPRTRLVLFALTWCVLWGVLSVRCWRPVPGLRTTNALAGVLAVALGVSLLWPKVIGESPRGVLVQDDVIVRKGDDKAFAPRFEEPIHQGVEFRVLETRPQWLHIELPDGQDGWVPRDAVQVVGTAIGSHRPRSTASA